MQGLAQSSIHGKAARAGNKAGKTSGVTRAGVAKAAGAGAGPRRSAPAKSATRTPGHVVPLDADGVPLPRLGWRQAIDVTVAGLGYELVDVERGQRGLLQVFIDRTPGRDYAVPGEFVTVEDCEQVTRQLQYVLEVEGLDYARLEVSSPGLDRPLRSDADFLRFVGQQVQVHLKTPFQGRKVYSGVLGRADESAAPGAVEGAGTGTVTGWSLLFKDSRAQEQVLGFKLEELREARLVPVVDFKGRKAQGDTPAGGQAGAAPDEAAVPGVDGGEGNR